jgi:DNA-binding NarL/FixJ family response regulator
MGMTALGAHITSHLRRYEGLGIRLRRYPAGLSSRQVDVLRLVARGFTNREIGKTLFISSDTVARHVHDLLEKTGTANRSEATAFAFREGLVD